MSKIWRRSLAGLAIGLAAQGVQAAPVVQPIASFGGSEYARVDDSAQVSWTAASAAVAAMGGGWHLATITTAAENTFVETTVLGAGAADRSHYWIGATDAAVEGTFAWVTGEPFSFADWGGGEPNDSNPQFPGDEDYLAYDYRAGIGWVWNDAPNDMTVNYPGWAKGYVIERRVGTAVPLPGVLPLLGIGLGLIAARTARRARA